MNKKHRGRVRQGRLRGILILILTVAASGGATFSVGLVNAGAASADVKSQQGWPYDTYNGGWCTWAYDEASDGSGGGGGGYAKVLVGSYIYNNLGTPSPCSQSNNSWYKSNGQMKVHMQYWKWFYSRNAWALCRDFAEAYNTSTLYTFGVYSDWKTGPSPCGHGWYYTYSSQYVYNGAWYGGRWSSGNSADYVSN